MRSKGHELLQGKLCAECADKPRLAASTPAQPRPGALHPGSRRAEGPETALPPQRCPYGLGPSPGELWGHMGPPCPLCLPSQPSLGLPGWM